MLRKRVDWKSNPAWTILLLACGTSDDVDVGSPGTFTQQQLADAVPLLTESLWLIAEAGDEYVVADVRDVAVDADGNSYVLDGPSVVVIDDAGRFVRRFGGPGPGPGELRSPRAVAVTADTVFIIDNAMLHLFLTGGLYQRSFGPVPRLRWTVDVQHTSAALMLTLRRWGAAYGMRDTTQVFVLERERSIGLSGGTARLSGSVASQTMPASRGPLLPIPGLHVAPDGRVFSSEGATYRIDVASPDGIAISRIVGDVRPVPVSHREFRAVVERLRLFDEERAQSLFAGQGMRSPRPIQPSEKPEHRPVVGRMFVSRDGYLIVERLDVGEPWLDDDAERRWDLIGPDFRIVGRFQLRRRFRPYVFDACSLSGVDLVDDAPVIARYRIRYADDRAAHPCGNQ
jgi:hypothetical protein